MFLNGFGRTSEHSAAYSLGTHSPTVQCIGSSDFIALNLSHNIEHHLCAAMFFYSIAVPP